MRVVTLLIGVVLISILGGNFISGTDPVKALAVIIGFVILIVSFVAPEVGLYILIFSMLLGPEINLGGTEGGATLGRGVTIRLDDFLLMIIGGSWFARMTIYKELGLFLRTPLNRQIAAYIIICAVSTGFGFIAGRVSLKSGFLFVLKYFEYFIVYFMAVNLLHTKQQAKRWVIATLVTCFFVSLYGIYQIPSGERVSAPFEGEVGEPNTFGGYLILMFSLVAGLFLCESSIRQKLIYLGLAAVIIPPFLGTLSRASYLATIPMTMGLLALSPNRRTVVLILVLVALLAPFLTPKTVMERITYTFTQESHEGQLKIGGVRVDTSTSARLRSWISVLTEDFIKHPILGFGVTGYRFLDAQYPRVLAETGILGFMAFLWLLSSIYVNAIKIYHETRDDFFKGVILGYICGFFALLAHAIGSNTFIIVRIMEPFWLLTAIVIMIPQLEEGESGFSVEG